MEIVGRAGWAARPPRKKPIQIAAPTPRLWLHHTATDAWHGPPGVKACQRYHMDTRLYNDIGYSFLADVDAVVYEGRGAGVLGAHTSGDNHQSHAVSAMGNFAVTTPSAALLEALAQIAAHGYRKAWWTVQGYTGGHRQAPGAATSCPGDRLQAAIPAINARVRELLAPAPPQEDEMTPEQDRMLRELYDAVLIGTAVRLPVDVAAHRAAKASEGLTDDTGNPDVRSLLGRIAAKLGVV